MFKVNNIKPQDKHHGPCSDVFIINLKIFDIFSTAFIVDFEHINIF